MFCFKRAGACVAALLFCTMPLHAATVNLDAPIPNADGLLTADDVNKILTQSVGYLKSVNLSGVISVVDREGHILAIYRMTQSSGQDIRINEQATVKARTAAFFQSRGNAFSTRTAQFIVQAHFPPGIKNVDAGPLFGVPFSNFGGAADIQLQAPPYIVFVNGVNAPGPASLPAGNSNFRPLLQPLVITPLTDDPGGLPLYKGKLPAGGIGVEIDGFGVVANGVPDAGVKKAAAGTSKMLNEEQAALAGSVGFAPPRGIVGSTILINGFRFKYQVGKVPKSTPVAVSDLATLGNFEPYFDTNGSERSPTGTPLVNPYGQTYNPQAVTLTGVRGAPTPEFPLQGFVPRFPPRDSPLGLLTAADVRTMLQQAANAAAGIRAAIRNPKGAAEQVWICVTDTDGNVCGVFRTFDATPFSYDVHVQKARTSAFFSNDQVGFSTRALGFIAQTTYPPGITNHPTGPISGLMSDKAGVDAGALGQTPPEGAGKLTEIAQLLVDDAGPDVLSLPGVAAQTTLAGKLSATVQDLAIRLPHIDDGRISPLQAALTVDLSLGRPSAGAAPPPTTIPDGITIFAGGVPIYKSGKLVGGLGVSGGGIDQDDIIAFLGQKGFEPPPGVSCDAASEDNIRTALQQAVAKLKVQFPNLTNGSTAVLDVIATRLNQPNLLDGLRLPYIKEPRSPKR